MNIKVGDTYLITTDAYFYAPNGEAYRSVWGTVKRVVDAQLTLGIKPNAKSTNWYIEIGNMIIAGCQMHYIIRCAKPNFKKVKECSWNSSSYNEFKRRSMIYNANERRRKR